MVDSTQTVQMLSAGVQSEQFKKEIDNSNILPTDDQLDRFVDSLCENIPSLNLNYSLDNFNSSTVPETCENITQEIGSNNSVDFEKIEVPVGISNSLDNKGNIVNGNEERVSTKSSLIKAVEYQNFEKSVRNLNEKRLLPNSSLNLAIVQCSKSLELLIEKRKNLELLVQIHHNVTNINYNFSYTPRLPDTPTRVDRLLYDVNQERCRILGLMSALEKTINSFSSKSTKDNLRKLLIDYGKAIVDVIKERQTEINYCNNGTNNYDSGVLKLVALINEVHRMNRLVHTALWCIEVKEQVGLVMSRKQHVTKPQNLVKAHEQNHTETVMLQKSWQTTKMVQEKRSFFPRMPRATSSGMKSRCFPMKMMHQHTNVFDVSPPRQKKETTMQLYAQQQRAEIFQHFSSTLKQSL